MDDWVAACVAFFAFFFIIWISPVLWCHRKLLAMFWCRRNSLQCYDVVVTGLGLPMSQDYGCSASYAWDTYCSGNTTLPCCFNSSRHASLRSDMSDYGQDTFLHKKSWCSEDPVNSWNDSIPLYRNDVIVEQPANLQTLCSRYAEAAMQFMSNSTAQKQPFFLYMAFTHMHKPITHQDQFLNVTGHGPFADALYELDFYMGKVIQHLEELGASNNTLLFITGDNGPSQDQCQFAGSVGPFVGTWQQTAGGGGGTAKTTVWEGGHREVALAYWPGKVPPNSVTNALASTLDVFPTVARLAGAALPPDRMFDGVDLSPVLFDAHPTAHSVLYHPNSGAYGPPGEIGALRYGRYKAVYYSGGIFIL